VEVLPSRQHLACQNQQPHYGPQQETGEVRGGPDQEPALIGGRAAGWEEEMMVEDLMVAVTADLLQLWPVVALIGLPMAPWPGVAEWDTFAGQGKGRGYSHPPPPWMQAGAAFVEELCLPPPSYEWPGQEQLGTLQLPDASTEELLAAHSAHSLPPWEGAKLLPSYSVEGRRMARYGESEAAEDRARHEQHPPP